MVETKLGNSTITVERDNLLKGYHTRIFISDEDLIKCPNSDWSRLVDEAFDRFQQELCYILDIKQES